MEKICLDKEFVFKNRCPYCDGDLVGSTDAWIEDDNGNLKADDLDLTCSKFPDINSSNFDAEFRDYENEHSFLVYEYWHPLIDKIKAEINQKYTFIDKFESELV